MGINFIDYLLEGGAVLSLLLGIGLLVYQIKIRRFGKKSPIPDTRVLVLVTSSVLFLTLRRYLVYAPQGINRAVIDAIYTFIVIALINIWHWSQYRSAIKKSEGAAGGA